MNHSSIHQGNIVLSLKLQETGVYDQYRFVHPPTYVWRILQSVIRWEATWIVSVT
jgi:hypothetical protein